MATKAKVMHDKPLSPHLLIYKPQTTSILSVFHRGTGVWLSVGTLVMTWWLVSVALGPTAYSWFAWIMYSWLGLLFLLGWTYSLFYHLCNGIRHLVWDIGYGFDLTNAFWSGMAVLLCSAGMTGLAWIVGIVVYMRWI